MDSTRHRDTVALVTGAASGIGRATALRLSAEGAVVIATDVDAAGLDGLRDGAPAITTVAGELTDRAFVDALVARAEAVGALTLVANVAGIMDHFVPAGEVADDDWQRVFDVNVTATMRVTRATLGPMVERGGGTIVNVSSCAGLGGSGAGAAYVSSKHAVIGFTKHVAFTYALKGIRCNAVCPGPVRTNIGSTAAPTVPWAFERNQASIALAGPSVEPDRIAASISWLASEEAATINGVAVPIDSGWRAV